MKINNFFKEFLINKFEEIWALKQLILLILIFIFIINPPAYELPQTFPLQNAEIFYQLDFLNFDTNFSLAKLQLITFYFDLL